jgi:predicted phosphodiesterase
MTTIIISDTHLSDKFELKKFNYLKKIIQSAEQVFINGDFWDKYFCTFDQFVKSPWQKLFPLLQQKQAIYLYGNHDRPEWCDERVNLFSIEQKMYSTVQVSDQELYITHGDEIAPDFDGRHPWIPIHKIIGTIGLGYKKWGLKIFGEKFLIVSYKYLNNQMKIWHKNNLGKNQILVAGHSHLVEYDLKKNYINAGFIDFGLGQYLKITDNQLELIKDQY